MIDIIKENKIDLLFEVTEMVTGISKEDICSKKRHKEYTIPRNIIGYILHKELELTVVKSAKILNRDHSTISFYSKMFNDNLNYFKEYKNIYKSISEIFWSQVINANAKNICLEVKNLQNIIDELELKKNKLLNIN